MDKIPRKKKSAPPITVVTPNPLLWKAALKQAGGDARRIEIVSETNLIVHPERR